MLGKVIEIYSEFTIISLYNKDVRMRLGDCIEFRSHSVLGLIIAIERESISVKIIGEITKIKSGDEVDLHHGITEISIGLFGNTWGEFDANLSLLDQNFNTKNLELSGNHKYDFIPVVRAGETVHKSQKLGYIELQKKSKYWILTPDQFDEYTVKKINSGAFGSDEKIVILDKDSKNYEVSACQQFGQFFSIQKMNLESATSLLEFDFTVVVGEFIDDEITPKELNQITFLTSQSDVHELVLQKSYNVALFLAYCGNKVLYKTNLEFLFLPNQSIKTINYEEEEGFLIVGK